MRIVITGGTGFLGKPLVEHLAALGYECTVLTRDPRRDAQCGWPPSVKLGSLEQLPAADAVIHLAGESIIGLWTARKRRAILASRIEGTQRLIAALRTAKLRPHTLLSASAVGFYGDRPGEPLDETSACDPRGSFRSEVCQHWEAAANDAERLGIRVVNLRIGNVMDRAGGYLGGLLPIYRAFGAFTLGTAKGVVSWISRADCVRMISFALANERWYGPLNLAHPEVLTHRRFALTLAKGMHRPYWGRVPSRAIRLMLGEAATTLLDDQRVIPAKATAAGFAFTHPAWDDFVRDSFASEADRASCQPALAR